MKKEEENHSTLEQISLFLKEKDKSWKAFFIEIAIMIVIVLFIRFYIFQFFRVTGPSMCPTLNFLNEQCEWGSGEIIFVNEFLYNFIRPPKRGEVVVFRAPYENNYYVKRVIGVPGDTITVENGKVYITNENHEKLELREPYLSPKNQGRTFSQHKTFIVPPGKYLLFGDNRSMSRDARQCFKNCYENDTPFIDVKSIKGRAEFVIWPPTKIRWIENPLEYIDKEKSIASQA